MNRKQEICLYWLAGACALVYVVIAILGACLLLRQPEPVPLEPSLPFRVYLPLAARSHPPPVEHGIAATYASLPGMCSRMQEMHTDWFYNWSYRTSLDCPSVKFLPMMRQPAMIGNEIPAGSEWLLGFNECGIEGQCPSTPCEGAIGWRELEQAYSGVKLGSPATLGWFGYSHLWWLEEWYACYQKMYGEPPRLDFVAAHCYGSVEFCKQNLTEVITFADSIGGLSIWVTEFGYPPHIDGYRQTLVFMEKMTTWFRANPRIDRWAWFALTYRGDEAWTNWGMPNTSLVDFDSGELTGCGKKYRELAE